jgi:phage protein D
MLDIFSSKSREPAECVINVDGTEITSLYAYLIEVTVRATRVNGAEGTLKFESRRMDDGTWTIQDNPLIVPWAEIQIVAKFGDTEEEVIRGYIKKVTSQYPSDAGSATVTVDFQDSSILLDRTHQRKIWGAETPTDDLSIIEEILSGTDISLDPKSDGFSGLTLNQNSTDIRFLRTRAASVGFELIFREDLLYFGPMQLDEEPQETIMVYAGEDTNCISISIDDDGHLPDQVVFDVAAESGSDSNQRTIEPDLASMGNEPADSSDAGLTDFTWRLDRTGLSAETDLEITAQAKANENAMKVKTSGELDGSLYGHVLHVGEPVGLDGVGERHNGIHYVDSVNHTFDGSGYRQSFQLLRNAYGDNLDSGPSNPLAAL